MRHSRFTLLGAGMLAAAIIPLLTGCGSPLSSSQQTFNHRVIAVVGDGSCDATAANHAETLRVAGLAASATADQRGTLLVDRVGRNALDSMTFPVRETFTVSSDVPAGNHTLQNEYLAGLATKVVAQAGRLLRSPTQRCGTDLAGSFFAIARTLQSYPAEPRTVIVVSNMLLVDKEEHLDFIHDKLSDAYVDHALKQLEADHLVPDLSGVSVALVGGGVDATEYLSQQREIELERFWRAYVEASHATLAVWEPQLTSIPDAPPV
jgi:hypothetical protein